MAARQETVSGLRPPPIFVEEEIGMKPQPQRAAAYPYVVVIVRRARRALTPVDGYVDYVTSRCPPYMSSIPPSSVINTECGSVCLGFVDL